jgi:hypothetical protein
LSDSEFRSAGNKANHAADAEGNAILQRTQQASNDQQQTSNI